MAGALLVIAALYLHANRPVSSAFAWTTDLEAGLRQAGQDHQLVLVKFHATWCPPCKVMDRDVFSREDVAKALARWVPVSVDIDEQRQVAASYAVDTVPTLVVLNGRGDVLARQVGSMSPAAFIGWIGQVEAETKREARGEK